MSRCAGLAVTTGRHCRARPAHGTAWCAFHHPFDRPVEAVGGPWDGAWLAAPCVFGGVQCVTSRRGAPGNAAFCHAPARWEGVLGAYVLCADRSGLRFNVWRPAALRDALHAEDRLHYAWTPAPLPDAAAMWETGT